MDLQELHKHLGTPWTKLNFSRVKLGETISKHIWYSKMKICMREYLFGITALIRMMFLSMLHEWFLDFRLRCLFGNTKNCVEFRGISITLSLLSSCRISRWGRLVCKSEMSYSLVEGERVWIVGRENKQCECEMYRDHGLHRHQRKGIHLQRTFFSFCERFSFSSCFFDLTLLWTNLIISSLDLVVRFSLTRMLVSRN